MKENGAITIVKTIIIICLVLIAIFVVRNFINNRTTESYAETTMSTNMNNKTEVSDQFSFGDGIFGSSTKTEAASQQTKIETEK